MKPVKTIHALYTTARQAEQDEDYETAISIYQQIIEQDDVNEEAYNRLMILYRKLKWYKEELRIINTAIKAYERLYSPKLKGAKGKKIAALSQALLRSTGLADKKGNVQYEPAPIATWKKRKGVVEKRLGI